MDVKKEGNKLTITVQLSENPPPSGTGKTLTLFTTHGYNWSELQNENIGINLTVSQRRKSH